jgi:hypothetical protein
MTGEQKAWAIAAWPICILIAWTFWLIAGCESKRALDAQNALRAILRERSAEDGK